MSQRSTSIRHIALRRPGPSSSLNPSPAVPAGSNPRQPTTCHTSVYARPYILAVILANAFPSRRQLTHRSPTNKLTCDAPARSGIVVPPRALSHLQTSPSPRTTTHRKKFNSKQSGRVFVVRGPEPARMVSLQKKSPASAEPTTPSADSGACAITSDRGPSLQHSDLDLDLGVYEPHGPGCGCGRGNRR